MFLFRPLTAHIREKERLEKILHEVHEAERDAFIKTSMDDFWLVDMEGRILDANAAYARLTGYSRDELLKMRVQDIEAMEKSEETGRHIQHVIKTGYDRFNTHHRCKDGRIIDVEISVTFVPEREWLFVSIRELGAREIMKEPDSAFKEVKAQDSLLTICASCFKIRDDEERWNRIDSYLHKQYEFEFSHGLCPECVKKLYPNFTFTETFSQKS